MGTSEDIPADVVQAEPMLEVELPTEDIPADVVPTEPILEVVLPTGDIGFDDTATVVVRNEACVPGSPVKKIKNLSELGVVQPKTSIGKRRRRNRVVGISRSENLLKLVYCYYVVVIKPCLNLCNGIFTLI